MKSCSRHLFRMFCSAFAAVLLLAACEQADSTGSGSDPAAATGDDTEAFSYAAFALESEDGDFDEEASLDPFVDVEGDDMSAWFDATDEEDVSDDPALELPADDPSADDPANDLPLRATVYHVRVVWGQPFTNPAVPEAVDWSGSISSNVALLKVRRLLRFERRTGDGIQPRTDRHVIEVRTTTKPHNDGLLLEVVVPAGPDDPTAAADADGGAPDVQPVLNIDLGPISLTYDIAALDGLSDLQIVDDMGNVVAVHAMMAQRPEGCARGFVAGYWKRLNRRGGVFGGRWIADDGETAGHIAGIWGRRLNGRRALFGLIRGEDGRFLGLMRGTYTPYGERVHAEPGLPEDGDVVDAPEPRPDGEFHARWIGRDRLHRGIVRGQYAGSGDGEGGFRGGWARACAEDPSAGAPGTPRGCEGEDCRPPVQPGCEAGADCQGPGDAGLPTPDGADGA